VKEEGDKTTPAQPLCYQSGEPGQAMPPPELPHVCLSLQFEQRISIADLYIVSPEPLSFSACSARAIISSAVNALPEAVLPCCS
jgi:hypothetical protein